MRSLTLARNRVGESSPISDNWLKWIVRRAESNLAKWGVQDFDTLGLAIAEESGELAQAILQARQEGKEAGRISCEAIGLAALCLQVLVTMIENQGDANIVKALSDPEP